LSSHITALLVRQRQFVPPLQFWQADLRGSRSSFRLSSPLKGVRRGWALPNWSTFALKASLVGMPHPSQNLKSAQHHILASDPRFGLAFSPPPSERVCSQDALDPETSCLGRWSLSLAKSS